MNMGLRTFLAIDLPSSLQTVVMQNIRKIKQELPGISWSNPENFHINLKFIGWMEESQVPHVRRMVEQAVLHVSPFDLELKGLGAFPDNRSPRVLWIGVGGAVDDLANLSERIGLEFPEEGRPFRPHLTVARVRKNHRAVGQVLETLGAFTDPFFCGHVSVERVTLFKSDLRPGGAVYTRVWDVSLVA